MLQVNQIIFKIYNILQNFSYSYSSTDKELKKLDARFSLIFANINIIIKYIWIKFPSVLYFNLNVVFLQLNLYANDGVMNLPLCLVY